MTDPLAPLRARFLARCADDLLVVRAGPDAPNLRRVVHRIAGMAGMFGYDALSDLASRIDDRSHAGQGFVESELAELTTALEEVAQRAAAEADAPTAAAGPGSKS
jgi:HPt (histidine-containing phosphotransfer) domain-containing protein